MQEMHGKVVFVTGGANGLGFKICEKFAKQGAKVAFFDMNSEQGKVAEDKLNSISQARFIQGNVMKKEDLQKAMDIVIEEFGKLDYGVNCAGVMGKDMPFTEITAESFDLLVGINVKGLIFSMQVELEEMLKNGAGSIVNMSSAVSCLAGSPKQSMYALSKHAVNSITRNTAVTYADKGISINALAPGTMLTPMIEALPEENQKVLLNSRPTKRFVDIDKVADMALYLCSDKASDMIGEIVVMDGGRAAL